MPQFQTKLSTSYSISLVLYKICSKSDEGYLLVCKSHRYYYQMQGQMAMSGIHSCWLWFRVNLSLRGIIPTRILYVFIHHIARSMWILTRAMLLDLLSALLLMALPYEKDGIFSVQRLVSNICLMLNPLSAITSSPSSRRSTRPLFWVMCWSLILSLYNMEKKVIAQEGIIPTRSLNALDC